MLLTTQRENVMTKMLYRFFLLHTCTVLTPTLEPCLNFRGRNICIKVVAESEGEFQEMLHQDYLH